MISKQGCYAKKEMLLSEHKPAHAQRMSADSKYKFEMKKNYSLFNIPF